MEADMADMNEITTLSMAGGVCGRGRALWNVEGKATLKWSSLSNSITIRVFWQVLQHYPFPPGYGRFLPSYLRGIHHNRIENAPFGSWLGRSHCQTAKSMSESIPGIPWNPIIGTSDSAVGIPGIPGISRSVPISWDLQTSSRKFQFSLVQQSTPVVLYKILSNPFSFIRRSSFMKLNIEINHLQTLISQPTQHAFRN